MAWKASLKDLISRLVDGPAPRFPSWLFFWIEAIAAAALLASV